MQPLSEHQMNALVDIATSTAKDSRIATLERENFALKKELEMTSLSHQQRSPRVDIIYLFIY